MSSNNKLSKIRNLAEKEIFRTEKMLSKPDCTYSQKEKDEMRAAEQQLRKALGTDKPAEAKKALELYKNTIDQYLPFWKIHLVREYAEAILIALVLALIIRHTIFQAFKIPSGSMIPTLMVGDQIVVNKFTYGLKVPFKDKKVFAFREPRRGEIIVFKFPQDKSMDFIKRVIGLPGDVIEYENEPPTRLWINGQLVERTEDGDFEYDNRGGGKTRSNLFEEKLGDVVHPILLDRLTDFSPNETKRHRFVVPDHHYFMMGDNRQNSNDSRSWGAVDFDLIKGKALFIHFSWPPKQLSRIGTLLK